MMYLWSDEQNLFSLTNKANLVDSGQSQLEVGSWCELKPDMKYTMKTSMKWPKIFTRTEDGLYPTLLRAAQLADSHMINDAKESERDVKFLVKIDIQ